MPCSDPFSGDRTRPVSQATQPRWQSPYALQTVGTTVDFAARRLPPSGVAAATLRLTWRLEPEPLAPTYGQPVHRGGEIAAPRSKPLFICCMKCDWAIMSTRSVRSFDRSTKMVNHAGAALSRKEM